MTEPTTNLEAEVGLLGVDVQRRARMVSKRLKKMNGSVPSKTLDEKENKDLQQEKKGWYRESMRHEDVVQKQISRLELNSILEEELEVILARNTKNSKGLARTIIKILQSEEAYKDKEANDESNSKEMKANYPRESLRNIKTSISTRKNLLEQNRIRSSTGHSVAKDKELASHPLKNVRVISIRKRFASDPDAVNKNTSIKNGEPQNSVSKPIKKIPPKKPPRKQKPPQEMQTSSSGKPSAMATINEESEMQETSKVDVLTANKATFAKPVPKPRKIWISRGSSKKHPNKHGSGSGENSLVRKRIIIERSSKKADHKEAAAKSSVETDTIPPQQSPRVKNRQKYLKSYLEAAEYDRSLDGETKNETSFQDSISDYHNELNSSIIIHSTVKQAPLDHTLLATLQEGPYLGNMRTYYREKFLESYKAAGDLKEEGNQHSHNILDEATPESADEEQAFDKDINTIESSKNLEKHRSETIYNENTRDKDLSKIAVKQLDRFDREEGKNKQGGCRSLSNGSEKEYSIEYIDEANCKISEELNEAFDLSCEENYTILDDEDVVIEYNLCNEGDGEEEFVIFLDDNDSIDIDDEVIYVDYLSE